MAIPLTEAGEATLTKAQEEFNKLVKATYERASEADKADAQKIATGKTGRYVHITPTVAAVIVSEHNGSNRDLSLAKVADYRAFMERGEWKKSPQGIAFYDKDSVKKGLGDGQHRMFALATVDEDSEGFPGSIIIAVDNELPEDSIDVLDLNKTRPAGDSLKLRGFSDPSLKGTMAKSLMSILNEIDAGSSLKHVSVIQVEKFVDYNDDLLSWAIDVGRKSAKVAEPCLSEREGAEVAFLMAIGGYEHDYASGFVSMVQQGIAPYSGAPHSYLTKVLTKAKYAERNKDKMSAKEKFALLLRGAYMSAQGANVTKVAWNPKKESFPTNHPPQGTQAAGGAMKAA